MPNDFVVILVQHCIAGLVWRALWQLVSSHLRSDTDPAQDIYIARAEQELVLEEELYWALINIYRRPELLYELTQRQMKDQ